jgi:hypothetical protein
MMLWTRRGLAWPGCELLFVGSLLFVALLFAHSDDLRRHWSSLHWEDQLFFDHDRTTIHSLRDCFVQPALWPGLYRPLTTNCYYYVGGWLFGHQIEVYHAINVLLYGLNALLLYGFVRHLVARPYALVAALLFVSRAAHVEVITNTVEFQVLLATFFALTALYLFAVALRQKRPWLVGVVYFLALLALFSKEAAIAIVALLPLYGWLFARPWQWSYLVGPLLVGASWLVLFVTALHLVNQDQATGFHFTVSPNTVVRNMTAHLWSFSNYFVGDESDPVLPPLVQIVANSVAGQGLLLLLGIGTFLLLVGKNHILPLRHLVAFGGAFFLLTVLPYSFFDDRLFIRYGYFSHAGLSIATAAAVALAVAQVKSFWRHRIKDYATVASA